MEKERKDLERRQAEAAAKLQQEKDELERAKLLAEAEELERQRRIAEEEAEKARKKAQRDNVATQMSDRVLSEKDIQTIEKAVEERATSPVSVAKKPSEEEEALETEIVMSQDLI